MIDNAADIARHRPCLDVAAVRHLLDAHYGLRAAIDPLPSDRDANFAVRADDGSRYVLKIAHALESSSVLEAQHAAMEHAARGGLAVPRVVPTPDGRRVIEVDDAGRTHLTQLLTYLPGVPLGTAQPRPTELLADVGRYVGTLSRTLAGFHHPAFDRELIWDLTHAAGTVADRMDFLDADERRLVEPGITLFRRTMDRYGRALRRSVVHNDANDHNLLVNGPEHRDRRVVGLIDFGDMLTSVAVADLAVAAAYAVFDAPDPLRAASTLVASYHRSFPLREEEVAVLLPMITARLCVSVSVSAHQRCLEPDNEYLTVSREPALRLLARLADIHPRLAEYVFRRDCGYEPCPQGVAVAAWCRSRKASAVVSPAPGADAVVFDFSVSSAEWSFEELTDPGLAARRIERALLERNVPVGLGRYGEVRLAYRGDQFETGTQMRTVHLGVDLFLAPGTRVCAPLSGIVYSLADIDRPFDYGPTVILEHDPNDGPAFYTLFGHLSRVSIEHLRVGETIEAGEEFAEIGTDEENGGWAPHLHFQIAADLLDFEGEFPGAAAPWLKDVWMAISPDPGGLLGMDTAAPPPPTADELLAARKRHVGPSLSIAYRRPVYVRRGYMAHLYDDEGQAYLDTVNNVAHVGHCHPRVVDAVARQMRVLNTNTRFLNDDLTRYAARLTARLPDPLSVCFFVNSGSEANDLALRLARARAGVKDVVVVDHAYHGNLTSLIEISPYKFARRGGAGRPSFVHVVPLPDPYRNSNAGAEHAEAVRHAIDRTPSGISGFFVESVMGCAGQVVFPDGFLAAAFEIVRAAGGVCIADEVQTGFGRVGESFWGFELQGVVPDVVTMGKPMGNGHPLGAVVTTPEIARSFDMGMEYFNTFGGNSVSCAAGLAVLDVLEDEGLQQHARRVGQRFLNELEMLRAEHEVIGDVRGSGLFLGVELVRERASKSPAGATARYVVDRMRDRGILAGLGGPGESVLKIKPPLVVDMPDADRYVEALDSILREDYVRARVDRSVP